jgi:energy-converting hydrogenase A subunit R
MKTGSRVFITDCEGPVSKNDNAFELMSRIVPKGDRLFTLISRFDDVLADIVKKPGYKAGDTLRLILPFLKAYGATNDLLKEYSSQNILLVPGADETLKFVNNLMPSYIVSTSYEHYIASLCAIIGFPKGNVYCTRLNIDKYQLSEKEVAKLKAIGEEISSMPMIKIPDGAVSLDDLPKESRVTVKRLNKLFWEEFPSMQAEKMLREVNPVGGYEKANAVKDIAVKTAVELSEIIYVGDSITDVDPFRLVRNAGGLTVSFNGNRYAVREAEIAVMSYHTSITSILADVFCRFGKQKVFSLAESWSLDVLKSLCSPSLFGKFELLSSEESPRIERVTASNMEKLASDSTVFRKTVRGEAVGKLG